jgi:hypothetical protein
MLLADILPKARLWRLFMILLACHTHTGELPREIARIEEDFELVRAIAADRVVNLPAMALVFLPLAIDLFDAINPAIPAKTQRLQLAVAKVGDNLYGLKDILETHDSLLPVARL